MLVVMFIIMFFYIVNTTIIIEHVRTVGKFDVGDLMHMLLGPLTFVTVTLIKLVSHFWDLDTPLWERK